MARGIRVLEVRFDADPAKASPEWVEHTKRGYPEDAWKREMLLDVNAGLGLAIFSREWKPDKHERPLEPNPALTMLSGWDFGRGCPAHIWAQRTMTGGLRILAELHGQDIQLRPFAQQVIAYEINHLGGHFERRMVFCDPAGNQNKDDGQKSVDVLRDFGWHPRWRGSEHTERHEYISRLLLSDDLNGEPMLTLDPRRCPRLAEAFRARYRRMKDGAPERIHPWTDLMDAFMYVAMCTKTGLARRTQMAPDLSYINEVSGYGDWGRASARAPQGDSRLVIDPLGATSSYR